MKTSISAQNRSHARPHRTARSRRTFGTSVALIGADGAGKTAVANRLLKMGHLPIKYLYMGTSIESSNVALPTSRLAHRWKVHRHKRSLKKAGHAVPNHVTLHGTEHRVDRRGRLGASIRLGLRLTEEVYRQAVSWYYQLAGNIVLYDRHFLFDACPPPSQDSDHRLTDRLHHWFLRTLYPRPQLVVFLDAPADVLYARKQEVSIDYLNADREALRAKTVYAKQLARVDATQGLDAVVERVSALIEELYLHREIRTDAGGDPS